MKKFCKRLTVLAAVFLLFAMTVVVLTSLAEENARIIWDFTGATGDIVVWESESRLFAYEPWSTADFEIENNQLVIHHMDQNFQCNTLDLEINDGSEDFSDYNSIAFWLDTSQLDRPLTIKVSIVDSHKNIKGVIGDTSYYLYYDNGVKEEKKAERGETNEDFLNLPNEFKGYIEIPFKSFFEYYHALWISNDIPESDLSMSFRLLLEFIDAAEGEVTRLDDIQVIKRGNPIGWVEETESSETPVSSEVSSSSVPFASSAVSSSQQSAFSSEESVASETSVESVGATGSDEISSVESDDESEASATSSEKQGDGGSGCLVVPLIILGVALVGGGGFALYKFVFSKK